MIFLLEKNIEYNKFYNYEKIYTYLLLNKIGCPVLKSVLLQPNEYLDQSTLNQLRDFFETSEVNVRYQYYKTCSSPREGGNRHKLDTSINSLNVHGALMWLLEPTDRFKNQYGINVSICEAECRIEIVGKGFDVSDINRGHMTPHQTITCEMPIRYGLYNEWWKFIKIEFQSQKDYDNSKLIRLNKLSHMNISNPNDLFLEKYVPLEYSKLETLLNYISILYSNICMDSYCVSCSVIDDRFIFWDIQTSQGKINVYGG